MLSSESFICGVFPQDRDNPDFQRQSETDGNPVCAKGDKNRTARLPRDNSYALTSGKPQIGEPALSAAAPGDGNNLDLLPITSLSQRESINVCHACDCTLCCN